MEINQSLSLLTRASRAISLYSTLTTKGSRQSTADPPSPNLGHKRKVWKLTSDSPITWICIFMHHFYFVVCTTKHSIFSVSVSLKNNIINSLYFTVNLWKLSRRGRLLTAGSQYKSESFLLSRIIQVSLTADC